VLSVDPVLVEGRRSALVRGRFDAVTALREALRGSGLQLQPLASGGFTLQRAPTDTPVTLQTMQIKSTVYRPYETPPQRPGFKADFQGGATKMPLSIRETPQAISVVTRESLDARQAMDINSALELVAGFNASGKAFAGHSSRTGEEFILRGQTLDDARDIRIDGFTAGGDRNNFDLASKS
jgi:outer membrane receptor for ferric coprogen and ferric-rhodotorulic acid